MKLILLITLLILCFKVALHHFVAVNKIQLPEFQPYSTVASNIIKIRRIDRRTKRSYRVPVFYY